MNVIFIMNDTFRRDHLGCYGNPWIRTPNLDAFSQHAARFEQYYAASYPTVPNRWDTVSGRYGFPFRGWQPVGREDVTWGEYLDKRGVHTQMIWDTPMLGLNGYNYTRGFKGQLFVHGQKGDPWITDPTLPIQMGAQGHKIRGLPSFDNYLRNHYHRRYEYEFCMGQSVSAANEWLETNYLQKSFFLWLDMWDPHEPFDAPVWDYRLYADPGYSGDRIIYPEYGRPTYMTEAERNDVRARYAATVTHVDRWLGRLFETIDKLGLFKNTLVIWASDHGHLFGEHNLQGKPGAELGTLYQETTHIPLMVHHPEGLGAGKAIRGIVQPPDLFPTILDFMGMDAPSFADGKSFLPLMEGKGAKIHDYAFSSRFPPGAGDASYTPVEGATFDGWVGSDRIVEPSTVTNDEWAFLCAPQGLPSELYHLRSDPQQGRNVINEHPDVAEKLFNAWIQFLQEHNAPPERLRPFYDANVDVRTPHGAELYGFRDDQGQWIAYPTEREAHALSFHVAANGPKRSIVPVTFGALLDDNPKNLIHLYGQYYWAQDLT